MTRNHSDDPATGCVAPATDDDAPETDDDAPEGSNAMPRERIVDQVTRRMNFSAAHPEIGFAFHPETGAWEATYPGGEKIQAIELRELLDRLEDHFT